MRVFFCLELDPALQQELDKITQLLRRVRLKVNWVKPENLHVTMRFLGEIPQALVPKLEVAARAALRESGIPSAVTWELDRVGAFPSVERPRVVWVGSWQEPEMLGRLAMVLQEKLEPLGFTPEQARFVTHITLGRVKDEGPAVVALTHALRALTPFRHTACVRDLTLMESRLTPQGSVYQPVFRIPFSQ